MKRIKIISEEEKKLRKIVKKASYSKHCIGCDGLKNLENPLHHPSIEITQKCNHNCFFCYSKLTKVKPGLYKAKKQRKIKSVTISQYGEPLLEKEKLEKAIAIAKDFGARVDIQTNGSLITKDTVNMMEKLGVDMIMISLNSSSREEHELITGADTFCKVLEGIELCSSSSIYTVVRSIYIPGVNDKSLIDLPRILAANVDEIFLQPLTIYRSQIQQLKTRGVDINRSIEVREFCLFYEELKVRCSNLGLKAKVTMPACLLLNLKKMLKHKAFLSFLERKSLVEFPEIKRELIPLPELESTCCKDHVPCQENQESCQQ